ncbi:hypothetical protein PPL_04851 [Heterostelium album PN500]|uniref:Uncharacterized protein n=1 Tax=Heterostelium pallidum (strain ATCC 26659 / Pp 5 / PN500) TaxID=670386 RepID=D3B8Q8_HETP5|nr:hypothetical protein PPL_04851 [Heterostelium album PN500]EFA82426.1 hypothetical protein PPL_04851 [Heterostelium album PN500]|eukprot:XP_020434543.1 hypothetical protein PPL_04851 [Heterostelium album PN500]
MCETMSGNEASSSTTTSTNDSKPFDQVNANTPSPNEKTADTSEYEIRTGQQLLYIAKDKDDFADYCSDKRFGKILWTDLQERIQDKNKEAKIDRALFLLEKMSKSSKASYSMSKISGVKWTEISDSARLKLRDSKITVKVKKGATAVNYQWLKDVGETQHIEFDEEAAVDNDEEEEQLSVMEWLERHIPIDQKHFAYHNVSNDGSFLLVSSYADCLPFSLKGTTAIIIAPPQRHRALLKSQIYVYIELKKPENLVDNSFYQGWAQLIAASIHTTSHPVIHLLTDLNEAWYFSWWSHPLELSHASLNNAQARSFIQEYLGEFKSGWLGGGDYSNNTGFKVCDVQPKLFTFSSVNPSPKDDIASFEDLDDDDRREAFGLRALQLLHTRYRMDHEDTHSQSYFTPQTPTPEEFDQYEVNSTSTPTTDSNNAFVITGNPGTGKSCFLFYIMYLIARVKGTMVVHSIHAKNDDLYFLYTYVGGIPVVRRGPKSDFTTHLDLRSTFFLVDSKEEINVAAKTIIVSSPDPKIYKEFLKNVGTARRYMPPWCKSELDHVRPILYPNVTQNAISTINLDLCVESIGKEDPIAPGSHKVIQIIPYEQAALPKYASMKLQFSSKYVAERVVKAVEADDINSVVKQLHVHKFLHSPLGGSFFESFAHRLLQQGGEFERRNLTTTATDKITFTPTVSSTLRSIADIGLSPPNKMVPDVLSRKAVYMVGMRLFVALHGSWNRQPSTGYQVVHIVTDVNHYQVNATLTKFFGGVPTSTGDSWSFRPVSLGRLAPCGAGVAECLLVSNDGSNSIVAIRYNGP